MHHNGQIRTSSNIRRLLFWSLLILAVPIGEIFTKKIHEKHDILVEKQQLDASWTLGPTDWVHMKLPLHLQMRSRQLTIKTTQRQAKPVVQRLLNSDSARAYLTVRGLHSVTLQPLRSESTTSKIEPASRVNDYMQSQQWPPLSASARVKQTEVLTVTNKFARCSEIINYNNGAFACRE